MLTQTQKGGSEQKRGKCACNHNLILCYRTMLLGTGSLYDDLLTAVQLTSSPPTLSLFAQKKYSDDKFLFKQEQEALHSKGQNCLIHLQPSSHKFDPNALSTTQDKHKIRDR